MELTKELVKGINSVSHYSIESFINDAIVYIDAIKTGKMFCIIHSVSASGMSRKLSFQSFVLSGNTERPGYYRNYFAFFMALGFKKKGDSFVIGGCGMDMVFHTNYTIMYRLYRNGLLTKEECDSLSQMTPVVF